MNQEALLPPSYEEMIPEKHLVRVVNSAIEKIDIQSLITEYKGGGTSSYHPKMMLKVMVYAYCEKIYSSRKIGKALRENIQFMWISGQNTPDFRTINDFRGNRMKGAIEEIFTEVLEYLIEGGHVKLENYFVDGTKIEANTNKHKVVWAKRNENYKKRVKEQIQELLKQIEQANKAEQEEYGDEDLEEMGGNSQEDINSERLKQRMEELNKRLREREQKKKESQSIRKAIKKIEKDCLPRLEKYEDQEKILAGRNSYAKNDPDASCMMMKEDRGADRPWPKPAYNIQAGTERQFIVGFSLHNRAGDTACLIPHLEGVRKRLGRLPKKVVADAAYGSEENYSYLEKVGVENYLKYNTFYQDTHHYRKVEILRKNQFRAENFIYDPEKDEFICPANQRLHFLYTSKYKSDNNYNTERRHYECHHCQNCPMKSQCTKAKGNRRIAISFKLLAFRKQARENLTSIEGQNLRIQRSVEVETVFGDVKHNMEFRRFHLRGIEKAKIEFGLVSIAHNLRKLAAK